MAAVFCVVWSAGAGDACLGLVADIVARRGQVDDRGSGACTYGRSEGTVGLLKRSLARIAVTS
jgi:hypothetical protein